MLNFLSFALVVLFYLFPQASQAFGQAENQPSHDKSQYHLFNPTPKNKMREFITDRPDRTESPITVDAGHFQIETDLIVFTRNNGETVSTTYNLMNLKAGITNHSDLQVVIPSHVRQGTNTGVGNTTLRFKQNLFGNEGGPSIALMPYVILPTQHPVFGESKFTGGLIVPVAFDAPGDFGIGMMFQLDKIPNPSGRGFKNQFISSFTAAHDLAWGLEGYIELFSQALDGAPWVATIDGGIILPVGEHVRFDLGANLGATEAADDITPFLGVSLRF
jgi:hypothetical protein